MASPEKQGNYITDTNKNGLLLDDMMKSYLEDGYLTQQELDYLKSQYAKEKNLIREDVRSEFSNLLDKTQNELNSIQTIKGLTKKVYVDSMAIKAKLIHTKAGDKLPQLEARPKKHERRETVDEMRKKEIKSFADVHSLGDFSRYIENFLDESMKRNEEIIGIDNIYKISFLTFLHTSVELGKGVVQVLKIGEGTAQTTIDISNLNEQDSKDMVTLISCMGGVGIDVLNVASIIPGVGLLVKQTGLSVARIGQLLRKIPSPPKITQMRGFAMNEVGAVGHGIEDIVQAKKAGGRTARVEASNGNQLPKRPNSKGIGIKPDATTQFRMDYEIRVYEGKTGFKDRKEGIFYEFKEGESLVGRNTNPGSAKGPIIPEIHLKDGKVISLDEWKNITGVFANDFTGNIYLQFEKLPIGSPIDVNFKSGGGLMLEKGKDGYFRSHINTNITNKFEFRRNGTKVEIHSVEGPKFKPVEVEQIMKKMSLSGDISSNKMHGISQKLEVPINLKDFTGNIDLQFERLEVGSYIQLFTNEQKGFFLTKENNGLFRQNNNGIAGDLFKLERTESSGVKIINISGKESYKVDRIMKMFVLQ